MDELDIILALVCVFCTLMNIGVLISILLVLRACQKMYTEYFKDRSITARGK